MTSYQGDIPGSSSNDPKPRINVIRVIKVEVEDDSEEKTLKSLLITLLIAVTLSLIGQWMFGKCTKRNRTQSTLPVESIEEEESEEFEIVSEPEEEIERATEEPRTSEAEVEDINPGEAPTVEQTTEGQTPEVQTTEVQTEEAPSSSTSTRRENSRGRKIYVTKYGEKYHLNRG